METPYPVRKALQFTTEQWGQIQAYRFSAQIGTEAGAVRRLIELGLRVAQSDAMVRDDAFAYSIAQSGPDAMTAFRWGALDRGTGRRSIGPESESRGGPKAPQSSDIETND